MSTLTDKVALVTGGNGGIGAGIAVQLAERGAKVVVNGRDAKKAEPVLDKIRASGSEGIFAAGDVRSRDDMGAVVEQAVDAFGGIDIVVPNAGGNDDEARSPEVRGLFQDIDLERVSAFVGQAVSAKLNVVQAAVPHFIERGGGSVVFITSEGGRTPTIGQTAISTFSGGLVQTTKLLSKELAKHRIRVNTVCVTVVRNSPSWTAAFEKDDAVSLHHRAQYQKIVERAPLGIATPEEIGRFVSVLSSDDSAYLTGAILSPTGGLTLH
ncbi:SDR family NAD(P)-dependent oxidoreductase [Brevibacterium sp. VCM10]|uniref:SDR family NAD(P)-dependent oxidoreductase n=1 Tax=Brevibacterium sp. VCM10 TaxID=1381751 RepID=UPI000472F6C4|nr:SDR family NAD(P)-dependent oxidoreductase [Brevibacterium sp. VCM10]